jgi:hypothetical protein
MRWEAQSDVIVRAISLRGQTQFPSLYEMGVLWSISEAETNDEVRHRIRLLAWTNNKWIINPTTNKLASPMFAGFFNKYCFMIQNICLEV